MGVLKRINGGIGQGQWGHWSGSMGVLKRVNGRWSGSWGNNESSMKDWSGSMGVLKRVNAGRWSGSMGAWRRVRVRQGCGCGSDGRLSYRVVSSTLQGCKLYLAGL